MKISKFLSAVCAAVMAVAVFSCTPPAGEGPNAVELNQNISFTLLVSDVTTESAKVTVTHDGDRNDTWYGFVTTEGNITGAVEAKVLELLSSGKISVKKTASTTVSLSGLEPGTDYYYVVFGLTAEGVVYGEPESVFFTTEDLPSAITYRENTAWNVRYTGEGTINGNKYDHTVTVNSTDKNYYIISVYTADTFNQYGIDAIANDAVADLKDWIASYNQQNNANITFSQMLYQGNGMDAFYLDAGESYRAIAVGAGTNGQPTGLYALSDVFTIADSGSDTEMSKEYSAWLGTWTLKGANNTVFELTLSKKQNNLSYTMTGWERFKDMPVEVLFNEEYAALEFHSQLIGTYEFQDYGNGDVYMYGGAGEYYYTGEYLIAVAGQTETGIQMLGAAIDETTSFESMFYYVSFNEQTGGTISQYELKFPGTLVKKSESSKISVKGRCARKERVMSLQRRLELFYPSGKKHKVL
jgi:hypothetical protein